MFKIYLTIIYLTLTSLAYAQTCAVRELTRQPDIHFVQCRTGRVFLSERQVADLSLKDAQSPHTFCTDGTPREEAVALGGYTQWNTKDGEAEPCDIYQYDKSDPFYYMEVPQKGEIVIDSRVNIPVRDINNKLINFVPPITDVVITGNREAAIFHYLKRLLAWIAPKSLYAAVSWDSSGCNSTATVACSGDTGSGTAASLTYSADVANNSNRYLIVGLCVAQGTTDETTAKTFNGTNLTLLNRVNDTSPATNNYLFGLANPNAVTGNVSFSISPNRRMASGTISLYGVHQTTSTEDLQTAVNNNDTTSLSVSVPTATDYMVVDVACKRNSTEALTMTAQSGRVQITARETDAATQSNDVQIGTSRRPTTGSATMNWSWSTNRPAALQAIDIVPAPTAVTKGRVINKW